jgi:hypothetical protein
MARAMIFVGCWPRWMSADLAAAHCDEPSFASIRGFVFYVLRTGMPRRPSQPSRRLCHVESLVA